MRAIAIGDNCIDYYDDTGRWYPTGNCVDSIVVLADLGAETSIITLLGDDAYAPAVEKLLMDHHVDISRLKRGHGPSPISHMKLGGESGKDRIHVSWDEGIMKEFALSFEDMQYISRFDLIHTQLYGRTDPYLTMLKKLRKTIVYDYSTGWKPGQHRESEAYVDYGFFSAKTEDAALLNYLQEAVGMGMKTAVATLGEAGSIAYDGTEFIRCGIMPDRQVVNTVGAGDAYIAGFMYGLMQGQNLMECMECGMRTSAEIVEVFEPYKGYQGAGGTL